MSIRQLCTWVSMASGTHRCFKHPSTRASVKPQELRTLRDVLKAMQRYFSERGENIIADTLTKEWMEIDDYLTARKKT